ncbi:endolytic transglycosylase MltG [uncultured Agrococcus sp.]|uniref:endolytic transglycosylase MltG n=1 Tax=uncultured Agrococcus sp. TaxID=382258 RepID=UPI0025DCE7C4|nr:endolytic transglycosylase MltG [uncultured Agrococcus sp.]
MAKDELKRSTYVETKKRGLAPLLITLGVILVLVIGGAFGVERFLNGWNAGPEDYEGDGVDPVSVTIPEGANWTDAANILAEDDVIASPEALIEIVMEDDSIAQRLQPGTFELRTQMSAQAALDVLTDPASLQIWTVTIPEGFVITQLFERLAEHTDFTAEEYEAAAEDPSAYEGVSEDSTSLEGWLFPATYEFSPESTPESILQVMVDRMVQSLDQHGVAEDERHEVLTMAALVQREGRSHDDFTRMSRVFFNRVEQGMLLQSDATVAYGTGHLHVVTTTPEEREDADNPYNTYVHEGLPPGPIGAPGDDAINAALNPADGPWLFFVTVNPETGETLFAETYEEHQQNVEIFQQWLRDNPEWGS